LPRDLDFEVWGLSGSFTGARSIGLWDVDAGQEYFRESAPVYRVTTHHVVTTAPVTISVCTVPKRPRPHGFGDYGFGDAAGSALHHAIDKAAWLEPGNERALSDPEVIRPGDYPDAPQWGRHRLVVGGDEVQGHFMRVRQAWVAVADLPAQVVAVSGCGTEPDAYELVPIADLSEYASRPWPGERRRRPPAAG